MHCLHCGAANPCHASFCLSCGRPVERGDPLDFAPTEPALVPGATLLDRYHIVRLLGVGGMGRVYLAEDRELGTRVALKVLREVLSEDPASVKRLKDEARLAMALTHEHIVRVNHFEASGPVKFLVMEYVEGETLAHRIAREKRLSEAEARRIGIALCDALAHAHAKGVLHRDVKPANVLLGTDGATKLADFGIARAARDSLSRLTQQETSGTLLYMAPEAVEGRPVDTRSDLYSLGATLYEMAAGAPPFHTGDVTHQILHRAPEPLRGGRGARLEPDQNRRVRLQPDQVSEEFDALVLRLLAKAPDDRPADAAAVRAVLDRTAARHREEEGRRQAEESVRRREEADARRNANGGASRPSASGGRVRGWPTWGAALGTGAVVIGSLVVVTLIVNLADNRSPSANLPQTMLGASRSGAPAQAAGVQWASIPAGTFQMGCVPVDRECADDEKPRHQVTLTKAFELMTTEVTVRMWKAYAAAGGRALPGQPDWNRSDDHPVVNVDWDTAKAFCGWLGGRLPTEAEWEYAARGRQDRWIYVWGNERTPVYQGRPPASVAESAIVAWYNDGYAETAPAGSFAPNGYGLYDMAGNVWEWVGDWHASPYPDPGGPVTDPSGPPSGSARVIRGGSWDIVPWNLRASDRDRVELGRQVSVIGVRCARDVPQ